MPEPRWTDQTREVVAHQLHRLLCIERDWDRCNLHGQHWGDARAILDALADAGLLLPPGSHSRSQHMLEWWDIWPGGRRRRRTRTGTLAELDAYASSLYDPRNPEVADVRHLTRTIHTGAWREVQP